MMITNTRVTVVITKHRSDYKRVTMVITNTGVTLAITNTDVTMAITNSRK